MSCDFSNFICRRRSELVCSGIDSINVTGKGALRKINFEPSYCWEEEGVNGPEQKLCVFVDRACQQQKAIGNIVAKEDVSDLHQ